MFNHFAQKSTCYHRSTTVNRVINLYNSLLAKADLNSSFESEATDAGVHLWFRKFCSIRYQRTLSNCSSTKWRNLNATYNFSWLKSLLKIYMNWNLHWKLNWFSQWAAKTNIEYRKRDFKQNCTLVITKRRQSIIRMT
jgi:hypothetical protein